MDNQNNQEQHADSLFEDLMKVLHKHGIKDKVIESINFVDIQILKYDNKEDCESAGGTWTAATGMPNGGYCSNGRAQATNKSFLPLSKNMIEKVRRSIDK